MREPRLQGTGWPTPGVPADRQMRPVWLLSGRDSPMRPEPLPTASPQARRWDSCSGETALALRGAASCRSKCPEPSLAHSLTALKQPPLCVQTVWSLQRLCLELRLKSLSGRKFVFPGPGLARPAERRLPAGYQPATPMTCSCRRWRGARGTWRSCFSSGGTGLDQGTPKATARVWRLLHGNRCTPAGV